ncbi:DUF835 domain-containing protein [Pyrococcus abyssi]|uniref:DUF835 domain-containing protein n=1 Tax=Pyrococcus abyssi (strain GE5 / Orsay) TaxID=272844 RepID=Q9UXT6_PYRAB|nr:DUF835 domain-containing protein [Pyrococcus abyssi]CAB50677.1 Hypothetical protein PAB1160 [Pyrococcus abyssi GE5]CCE71246.1 TPA: hypothetical protein PAB1160 [Pyrococcus abyssi GE5]
MVNPISLAYRLIIFVIFAFLSYYVFLKLRKSPEEFKSMFIRGFIFLLIAAIVRAIDVLYLFIKVPYYSWIHIGGHILVMAGITYTYVEFIQNLERFFFPKEPTFREEKAFLATSFEEVLPLMKGRNVLAITRDPDRFLNKASRIIWVTSSGENGVPPTSLHVLLDLSIRFANENRGGVIILDCLEFLILYNGFNSVFKFLTNLKDNITIRGGILVIIVAPKALGEREMNMLKREFRPIITSS